MALYTERIVGPWYDSFLNCVRNSKETIRIASPFIKQNVAKNLIETKPNSTELRYLNSFKLQYFYTGASDLTAIETLIRGGTKVHSLHRLHAKIYIFDEMQAIVTSANLTHRGLFSNYEYGILLSEPTLVKQIIEDFDRLFSLDEETSEITASEVRDADNILRSAPKQPLIKLPELIISSTATDTVIDEFAGGSAAIIMTPGNQTTKRQYLR
jgi:phosphatidylserine/phosphatidylglycerophosphate/cardiolipin synthase-like enzyme